MEGLKIYGSSWQPLYDNTSFYVPRGQRIAAHWAQIPDDVDVLVTHTPPLGRGDRAHGGPVRELSEGLGYLFGHMGRRHQQYSKKLPDVFPDKQNSTTLPDGSPAGDEELLKRCVQSSPTSPTVPFRGPSGRIQIFFFVCTKGRGL